MPNTLETLSLILVGALWGCTNPLLRQGAVEVSKAPTTTTFSSLDGDSSASEPQNGFVDSLCSFFIKLKNMRVWLPYVVNQLGSVMYYFTLANSNLSLAVPICNALALVFSIFASIALGEPIRRPWVTIVGATLVVTGVTLCLHDDTSSSENMEADATNGEL